MDLPRLGKNVLFALLIFVMVAAIDRVQLPWARQFGAYVEYVLSTEFHFDPLAEVTKRFKVVPDWLEGLSWWKADSPNADGNP